MLKTIPSAKKRTIQAGDVTGVGVIYSSHWQGTLTVKWRYGVLSLQIVVGVWTGQKEQRVGSTAVQPVGTFHSRGEGNVVSKMSSNCLSVCDVGETMVSFNTRSRQLVLSGTPITDGDLFSLNPTSEITFF